jgi:hypothetical protein
MPLVRRSHMLSPGPGIGAATGKDIKTPIGGIEKPAPPGGDQSV